MCQARLHRIVLHAPQVNQTRDISRNACRGHTAVLHYLVRGNLADQMILPTPGLFRSLRPQSPTNSGTQGASAIRCTTYCTAPGTCLRTHVSQKSYSPEMTFRYLRYFLTHYVTPLIHSIQNVSEFLAKKTGE